MTTTTIRQLVETAVDHAKNLGNYLLFIIDIIRSIPSRTYIYHILIFFGVGEVTIAQQQSVHNISGHSAATAKKDYIIPLRTTIEDARRQDAAAAKEVMTLVTGFVDKPGAESARPRVIVDTYEVRR
jgi:hypothetical protein